MRLILDLQGCQTTGSRFRGIGRYSSSLAKALLARAYSHECWVVLNGAFPESIEPIRRELGGLLPQERIQVWQSSGPVAYAAEGQPWRRPVAEVLREFFLDALRPDMVHVSSVFEGFVDDAVVGVNSVVSAPTAATLYDLIPLIHQDIYLAHPSVRRWYHDKLEVIRQTQLLLAISESSRQEAIEYLHLPASRVVNISSAADPMFQPIRVLPDEEQALRKKLGLHKPFVMYTGGIDHRKNIEGLIRAFAMLPPALRGTHQLAVVCKASPEDKLRLDSLARSVGLTDGDVVLTGFVSDKEMVALCNLCKLFVFPSWHEGFGLPALEAMACGAPVIASNTSSLPEVVGREDALFDPRSDLRIAEKMGQALSDDAFRSQLAEHGKRRARLFSWDESARRSLDAMEAEHERRVSVGKSLVQAKERKKLRLAFVSPLPPERTGIADYSAELLPALAQHYEIDLVTDQAAISDSALAGLRHRSVAWFEANAERYDRILYQLGNSAYHEHMFGLLAKFPGVVVLHDFYLGHIQRHRDLSGASPGAWAAALYESHGYPALVDRSRDANGEAAVIKYPCNATVLRDAVGVIVHSQYARHLAEAWYELPLSERVTSIPQIRRIETEPQDRIVAREALGLKKDAFVVASFGFITPAKLADRLVRSWLQSGLSRSPDCLLVLVGESPSQAYLAELQQAIDLAGPVGDIRITGYVTGEQYREYLCASDVAVQLRGKTRGETSRAVLDCLAHRLPTIVNAHGATSELPEDIVSCLPDDFSDDELVSTLEALWQDSEQRLRLGVAGARYVAEQRSPQRVAQLYRDALEEFERHSPRRRLDSIARGIASATSAINVNDRDLVEIAHMVARVQQATPMGKQLFVDISTLVVTDAKSGIQRVVRSVLGHLLAHPPSGFRVEPVYADGSGSYFYARRFTSRLLGIEATPLADDVLEAWEGDVFLGLDLAAHVVPNMVDYFEDLRRRGVEVSFVLYDLLPALQPQWFPPELAGHLQRWYGAIAQASDRVIAISRAVGDEFKDWLDAYQPQRQGSLSIGYFHLGADIESSMPTRGIEPPVQSAIDALQAKQAAFLMVGTVEPRKGHAQVLDAFEELWKDGSDAALVIVGKRGWRVDELAERLASHPQMGRQLFWFEGVSDEALECVYRASSLLLAASFGEGFGLPLVEAARRGLPILARDLPVFREVAGDGALYFEAGSSEELAGVLRNAQVRWQDGSMPQLQGMQTLSWADSTQQLLDAIEGKCGAMYQWLPGHRRLYRPGHPSLHSQVATVQDGSYRTSGTSGFLVYGPYVELPAGSYLVRLTGTSPRPSMSRFDVVTDQGATVLAEGVLQPSEGPRSTLFSLEISLSREAEGLELRLWVDADANVRVDAMEIMALNECLSADNEVTSFVASSEYAS